MNSSECRENKITIIYQSSCFQTLSDQIINKYLIPIIQMVSLVYTVVCIVIFWKIIRHEQQHTRNGNMFNYLFFKSIFDFLSIVTEIGDRITSLESLRYSYITQVINNWIYLYLNSVVVTIAIYSEIFATFDCYLFLNNFTNFFKSKKSYYINLTVLVIVSFSINIIYLFRSNITRIEDEFSNVTSKNNNNYQNLLSCFSYSTYFIIISTIVLIIRDFLPIILLLIINVLIVLTLKRIYTQKKILRINISDVYRAQTDKIKMMSSIAASLIIGRTPYMIYILPIHDSNTFWECTMYSLSNFLFYIPYGLQIIFFYRFNKIFRKYLKF
jgi:hypothetical protein